MIRRREFIAGLGGAAAWPMVARAQQMALPVVGVILGWPNLSPSGLAAYRQGLGETGYAEGRNVTIEYRWTEGQNGRLRALVNDLKDRRVAVIAALSGTAAALAAKEGTPTIPIVFRIGSDPIANGIVPSLSRPGGNVTGITTLGVELGAKRLDVLRELLPAGATIVLLANPTNANGETEEIQAAAPSSGVRLLTLYASSPSDIEEAFASMAAQNVAGLMTGADPLMFEQRDRIIALVARLGIPAIYSDRLFVESGGLMSYGANSLDGFRLAGAYTGRILNGEKPANLPVQRSTKVEFALNLRSAKAFGISLPRTLLGRADEVIE
jgi:putative tryptophan/tyrosine transport system substrate-binding protein